MFKRIMGLGIALLMIFSLSACVPEIRDNELAEYKVAAKAELETYAQSKGQDNYGEENWTAIQNIVADGKTAINAAANKVGVDSAREAAEADIDAVDELSGKANWDALYQTALGWGYYDGFDAFLDTLLSWWGSKDDRDNAELDPFAIYIKYHPGYRGTEGEWIANLTSTESGIDGLDAKTKRQIERDYFHRRLSYDLNPKHYYVDEYYGIYNGYVCLSLRHYINPWFANEWSEIHIAGLIFIQFGREYIAVWKDGYFYGLSEAYYTNLLTQEDVFAIKEEYDKYRQN